MAFETAACRSPCVESRYAVPRLPCTVPHSLGNRSRVNTPSASSEAAMAACMWPLARVGGARAGSMWPRAAAARRGRAPCLLRPRTAHLQFDEGPGVRVGIARHRRERSLEALDRPIQVL